MPRLTKAVWGLRRQVLHAGRRDRGVSIIDHQIAALLRPVKGTHFDRNEDAIDIEVQLLRKGLPGNAITGIQSRSFFVQDGWTLSVNDDRAAAYRERVRSATGPIQGSLKPFFRRRLAADVLL